MFLARMIHECSTAETPPSSERSEEIIQRAAPPALRDPQAPCQAGAFVAS